MPYSEQCCNIPNTLKRLCSLFDLRYYFLMHFVLYYFSTLQTWLADWLMENNPNKPKISVEVELKEAA